MRDLDPEGLIRNEEIVGLRQIELWHMEKAQIDLEKEIEERNKQQNNKQYNNTNQQRHLNKYTKR